MNNPSILYHLSLLLILTGCGQKDQTAANSSTPPPPPPPPVVEQSSNPLANPAAAQLPPPDPAAAAKMDAEEDSKLKARLAAGEEGTTPDPVGDKNLWALQAAYDSFYNAYRRDPRDLQEMVRAGYLRAVPPAPAGKQYVILPEGGGIQVSDKK